MVIGVDIGNTTVEVGFKRGERLHSYKLKTDINKTTDDWFLDINQILSIEGINQVNKVLISSVVPSVEGKIKTAFSRYGVETLLIGKDIPVPIKNRYRKPDEVGIDRLVNSYWASKKYKPPLIIVDLGTAITFDVVNTAGEYEGGAIFPGIETSINCLFSKTAKLPSVSFSPTDSPVGKATTESIQAGLYFGYISLIEGMVKRINENRGYTHKVVITGGNAPTIHKGLPSTILDKHLSMEGILSLG
ncbi:MAG: type III pantothenate kinase [Aquificae bacterium]|nr:type III pantothenate kinase [Aquificota bacterium]